MDAFDTDPRRWMNRKRKWYFMEAEKLAMIWRYGWLSYKRGPPGRDYAMSRIKTAFEGLAAVGRLPQEAEGAEEIATDDSDKDSDVDQCLAEVQQPSVGDDDVLVVDEPEPPKPGPRRISKKMSDPISIESDSPRKPPAELRSSRRISQSPSPRSRSRSTSSRPAGLSETKILFLRRLLM